MKLLFAVVAVILCGAIAGAQTPSAPVTPDTLKKLEAECVINAVTGQLATKL